MEDREVGSWGRVIMVVGMQWGSEGKGAITEYLSPIVWERGAARRTPDIPSITKEKNL